MGWWRSMVEQFAAPKPSEQDVLARLLPFWQSARPLPQPHDYRAFAQDGYRRNTVIFGCITEIVTSAAEPVLTASRVSKEEPQPLPQTDPLSLLVARPNPEQSPYDLLSTLLTHMHVAGNGYLHKVRARNGKPVQLWTLRPDRVRIKPGSNGMVESYAFTVGDQAPRMIPAEDVIHFPLHPDPLDDYYGLSPIAVLARFGDLDNQAADFLRAFFLNAGVPGGLLKFKAGRVGKEERERVRQLWVDQFSTERGWHAPGVIDADVEYESLASNELRRLDLASVWSVTESRICMTLGVPAILVGAWIGLRFGTYANYKEAKRSFWDETLSPLYRRLSDKLTHGLASEFGPDRRVGFDLSTIEALQENREVREGRALKAWEAGVTTMNQAAVDLGYPETPDGNVRKLPFGVQLIPAGNGKGTGLQSRRWPIPLAHHRPKALHALFVDEVPDDPFYLAVHKIADRLTPAMRDAFLRGVLAMNGAIDELALIAAVETGQFDLAMAAIPFEPFADSLKTGGGEILLKALSEMGMLAATTLKDTHGLTIAFDLTNPRAQAFAATQTATMVTEVTEGTKESIRAIIERGFSEHLTPQDVAKEIRQVVGLTSRQAQAVVNFRSALVADGIEGELLETRVGKYASAQLRYRGTMIARQETLTASNAGQRELWMQAQEKTLLPQDQRRVFIVTPDDRLDAECEALDGEEAGLNEPFPGGFMDPPIHIMCRCTTGLIRS